MNPEEGRKGKKDEEAGGKELRVRKGLLYVLCYTHLHKNKRNYVEKNQKSLAVYEFCNTPPIRKSRIILLFICVSSRTRKMRETVG